MALASGSFQFLHVTSDARASTDVQTIGPDGVYDRVHQKELKRCSEMKGQTEACTLLMLPEIRFAIRLVETSCVCESYPVYNVIVSESEPSTNLK